jgi:uncharacterized protein (DUF362 family)
LKGNGSSGVKEVSFFIDPPVLIILGVTIYYFSKRFKWSLRTTAVLMALVSLGFFMGGSSLLYLDVLGWPLPPTLGSVWMFHTDYTGIAKTDVHAAISVFMLLLYPLWHLGGYLLALRLDVGSFLWRIVTFKDVKSQRSRPSTKISVERGHSPRENTRKAIESIGGMDKYVKKGDKVLIKANICGGNPHIPGFFTSPDVVDELIKMIQKIGAKPSIIDSDMIWTKFDPIAEAEKWKEYARKTNIPLINLAETDMVRFNFGEESAIGIVPVSKEMIEADVIISAATMKTHLLTNVTLAMKNMYGSFPEENKAKFHRFGIENVIFEVNKAFTPNLTIIDGSVGGEAFGPLSSKPVNFETIIAANDVVAADSVACQLMGYDPLEVKHVKKAHEAGLGDANVTFDTSTLAYPNEKDKKWEKPDPAVTELYEGLVEAFLHVPGMQVFFDGAADFVLFGLATLPFFREATPEVEKALNQVLSDILRSISESGLSISKWTEENAKKMQDYINSSGGN